MEKKILEGIKPNPSIRSSYLSSVYSVLSANQMFKDEPYLLAGMMGLSFHFIVHHSLCPSSVTVYDWQQEHTEMLDRIGIHSEVFQHIYNPNLNNYESIQKMAIKRIKDSIDNGVGVVTWAPSTTPEFGVIKGYDQNDRIFFIQDYTNNPDVDPILYDNIGKSEVSVLSYQLIYEKKEIPQFKIYKDSLLFALNEWEKEHHTNPMYRSGKKGYESLINALESNNFDKFGFAYMLYIYSESKSNIYQYLKHIYEQESKFQELKEVVDLYQKVSKLYKEMEEIVSFPQPQDYESKDILQIIKTCYKLEDEAMSKLKVLIERIKIHIN